MTMPSTFAGSILLMIAIVFALVSIVMTFINSRKLKGEVFEKPFVNFALGMFFFSLSMIAVTFFGYLGLEDNIIAPIHDISFIIGFVFMLAASMNITKYLLGLETFAKNLKKRK